MKQKRVPLRVCAGCQEQKSKKEMIRIVRTPEGAVEVDKTGKNQAAVCISVKIPTAWKKPIRNIVWTAP